MKEKELCRPWIDSPFLSIIASISHMKESMEYNGSTEILCFGTTNNATLQKFSVEITVLLEGKLCWF